MVEDEDLYQIFQFKTSYMVIWVVIIMQALPVIDSH